MALLPGGCVAARVRRVNRVVVRTYDDALRNHGLTVAQLDMLATMLDLGPMRPAELGAALLMERSTVSRNLARLRKAGLVEQLDDGTGTRKVVGVTAEGERLARAALVSWERAQDTVVETLGPDGLEALELLVDRLGKEHLHGMARTGTVQGGSR